MSSMGNSGLFVASSVMVSKKESTESEREFDPGTLGTSGVFTEEANARGTGLDVDGERPFETLNPRYPSSGDPSSKVTTPSGTTSQDALEPTKMCLPISTFGSPLVQPSVTP